MLTEREGGSERKQVQSDEKKSKDAQGLEQQVTL